MPTALGEKGGVSAGARGDAATDAFHPLVAQWLRATFAAPTAAQRDGWPQIAAGADTLIAAPTGSGKTLAAFLWAIDELVRAAAAGTLAERVHAIYVSPLKALGNDIQKNLRVPLAGIAELARAAGPPLPDIRVAVRSGDTPARERQLQLRKPPHILVTTPGVALHPADRRGQPTHAARSAARSSSTRSTPSPPTSAAPTWRCRSSGSITLAGRPLQRIGLSATQKPIEEIARLLVGAGALRCATARRAARSSTSATAATSTCRVETPGSGARPRSPATSCAPRSTTASPR